MKGNPDAREVAEILAKMMQLAPSLENFKVSHITDDWFKYPVLKAALQNTNNSKPLNIS